MRGSLDGAMNGVGPALGRVPAGDALGSCA